jgi:NAD(P)-dependent dehydrogenase (short-subunit alcohol dehydrogenase family)
LKRAGAVFRQPRSSHGIASACGGTNERMTYSLPNISHDLTGQTALVTGASSGLGLRFAKVLASCGAKVVLAARRVERLEALAAEIKAGGGEAFPLALDATRAEDFPDAVKKAQAALGLVTILVNNAGIPDAQRAHKMPLDLIDNVIDTNIRAPFVLSCEVARYLIAANKPGRIVNIASAAAFDYKGSGAALYSVSKAAVVRITETLAVEWARYGINVNAIAPGAFASEMMDGMLGRMGDITAHFPRKRLGDPAQLDSTLLYLVSPASDAVTGTCIRVDDGQHGR